MMVSEKESKLVKISKEEYEEVLRRNATILKNNLKEAETAFEDFMDTYRTYLIEKNQYRIEYFKGKNTYIYKKFIRKIGFR